MTAASIRSILFTGGRLFETLGEAMRFGWILFLLLPSCSLVRSFDGLTNPCGDPFPIGWSRLPSTTIANLCNPSDPFSGCAATIVHASAVVDTNRCRMVVWGGGGGDSEVTGNEVYALDLPSRTMLRLSEPSEFRPTECMDRLPDGTPQGRLIGDALVYAPETDHVLAMSGYLACTNGDASNETWAFDLATAKWSELQQVAPNNNRTWVAAHDATSGKVFVDDGYYLFDYDETTGYTKLTTDQGEGAIPLSITAAVDTTHQRLFLIGGVVGTGRLMFADIGPSATLPATFIQLPIAGSGCEALAAHQFPGVAYDAARDRFVGWLGGADVIVFDPNLGTCTTVAPVLSDNPPPTPMQIAGRWQYVPDADAFVAIPNGTSDAWVLRLL